MQSIQEDDKTISTELKEIWRETREWRKYWKTSDLFKALVFSFVFSLFDMGTDFNFAWSVPSDCPTLDNITHHVFSPCGKLHPKQVEWYTYVFIACPTIWVGCAALFDLLKQTILQCGEGKVQRILSESADAFGTLVQVSVSNGFFVVAAFYPSWAPGHPGLAQGFTFLIKALAYLSAIGIIGVKLVGLFNHGPKTKHLIFQATDLENRWEADYHCI